MHKEATTSGVFNPSTLESFEQIALVGVPHIHIKSESCAHPFNALLQPACRFIQLPVWTCSKQPVGRYK